MRYRPFGPHGRSISALTLVIGDEPKRESERVKLVYAALESGVNAFELRGEHMLETAAGLARALSAVPREAVVISLRLPADSRHGWAPFTREWVIHAVERTVDATGLGSLDLLTFDLPTPGAFNEEARAAAVAARAAGRVGLIGVAGAADCLDFALRVPEVDLLVSPYHLRSGWPDRNRLKSAAARGLVVLGADFYPSITHDRRHDDRASPTGRERRGLFGLGRKPSSLEQVGAYGFLGNAPGWTPREVCLAYALTEPTLSSMLVEAADPKELEGLAQTAERDLPVGVPAQIEMARFAEA